MSLPNFLPSEIARLVLGYLSEIGCANTHDSFLAECPDLREYASLHSAGFKFPTSINDKSLLDILAEYCQLRSSVKDLPQTPSSVEGAGAVYRAARQALTVPSILPAPQSCPPPINNTPTHALSSPVTVAPEPDNQTSRKPIRRKYGQTGGKRKEPVGQHQEAASSVAINPNDPLAGVEDLEMFSFAQALAQNINSVVYSEEDLNRRDAALISPEKAGQIIEMTEHDPKFEKFVRSLFSGDSNLSFDDVPQTSQDQEEVAITDNTRPVGGDVNINNLQSASSAKLTQPATPTPSTNIVAQEVATLSCVEVTSSYEKNDAKNAQGDKKAASIQVKRKAGRPSGSTDKNKRIRTCKAKSKEIEKVSSTTQPVLRIPIPRLPRPPPPAPVNQLNAPLSMLFNDNEPGVAPVYLMNGMDGNYVMVQMHPSEIVSTEPPVNVELSQQNLAPQALQGENVTNAPEQAEPVMENPATISISVAEKSQPAESFTDQANDNNTIGTLDSLAFDDLLGFHNKSPIKYPARELRTPPDDSQTSFLHSFPPPNNACQRLVFDGQLGASSMVTSQPRPESVNEPVPIVTQSLGSEIPVQSTADSQQQNGRIARRVPLIPVPTFHQSPHAPPPGSMRRTRNSNNREINNNGTSKKPVNSKRKRD